MFGRDWEEAFRARRIQQFFDATDKHSLEDFRRDAGGPRLARRAGPAAVLLES